MEASIIPLRKKEPMAENNETQRREAFTRLGAAQVAASLNANATHSQTNRAADQPLPATPITIRRLHGFGI